MINKFIKRINLITFSLSKLKEKIDKWTLGDRGKTEIRNDVEFIPLLQKYIKPVQGTYYRLVDNKEYFSIIKNNNITYNKITSVSEDIQALCDYVAPIFPKRKYLLKIIGQSYPISEYANDAYKKQKEGLIVNQTFTLSDKPSKITLTVNEIGHGKVEKDYTMIVLHE